MRTRCFGNAWFSDGLLQQADQLARVLSHDAAGICWPGSGWFDQDIRHTAQLLALQVTTNEAGLLASFGFRPNGVLQGVIDVGQA